MDIREIVNYIITDPRFNTSDALEPIRVALNERQKLNRANGMAVAKATLCEGDEVILQGLRPKYWNGMKAVVVGFNSGKTRVKIRITDNNYSNRVRVGDVRDGFPIDCLKPTGVAATSTITQTDANALLDFMSSGIGIDPD